MSNLETFAEREMRDAGLFDKDSDYDGALATSVMELVRVFSAQGHSGASAGRTLAIFAKVAAFEPLGPLTGGDDEWVDQAEQNRRPLWQNRRCSHVFKTAEGAYDIEGRIFRDPDGTCWTSSESRVPVTFPYVPRREYVDRPATEG